MNTPFDRRAFLWQVSASLSAMGVARVFAAAEEEKLPPVRAITRGPQFHWRGYYDKLLFDASNRFVLANEVNFEGRSPTAEDALRVGMVDTHDGDKWIELGNTKAWNWQQGCMLQWVPGSEHEVAWNDRAEGEFISRVHNVKTGQSRTLPHPFYCFTPDGKTAFAPDFRRLNDTRPGYGYSGVPDPNREVLAPEDAGIWHLDLSTRKQKLIFSFADAKQLPFTGKPEAAFNSISKHWFNHLLCNPTGTRLFFLHRWRTGEEKSFHTRALTMNLDGTDVHVLDPWGATSHFVWRDATHICAFAWHPAHQDRFYLYEDKSDKVEVIGPDKMTVNGHNTYVPGTNNEWILNDTYPDARRFQHPYVYHIPTNRRVPLGHFPSPREYTGEWRCDNHPNASRDGKKIVFDSPHEHGRQVYLIDISEIVGT